MKIVVIGTGYVGLVSGACFSHLGWDVVCVDNNPEKVSALQAGKIPIYEPGLEALVKENVDAARLTFAGDVSEVVEGADIVLLAVGTPTDPQTGRADLTYIYQATEALAKSLSHSVLIITKSTVPVGTGNKVKEILDKQCPELECLVASNPEFLREGSAVQDFLEPDRIIVGSQDERAKELLDQLYAPLTNRGYPILHTDIATAELIKYASNAFLATKIAFANEIADICEGVGANISKVIQGMGMDKRIGAQYMQPGPGYGGSCFPKDTLALTHIANDAGSPTAIVESVIASNDNRKKRMADRVIAAADGSVDGKNIAILGLTFKANTDDMRYSSSLDIVPALVQAGAKLKVYDPEGMAEAKKLLTQESIVWCDTAMAAYDGADIVVIVTEWDEFRAIDMPALAKTMQGNVLVDLRNLYRRKDVAAANLNYFPIGKTKYS